MPVRPTVPIVAWMTGALACFVLAALAVRALSEHADPFQIGLVRTGVGLSVLLAFLAVRPALARGLGTADLPVQVLRNVAHGAGGVLWTIAIATLPLATVFSLEFTAPAWVAILAYPLLGERVSRRALAGIAACTVGVLVILRPGPDGWTPHLLTALAAAFCFGLTIILTRRLALKDGTFCILFWMMALQMAFYAVVVWTVGDPPPAGWAREMSVVALVLGFAGLGSQFCVARALSLGEAATVVPLDFLRVPIVALIGAAFFGEAVSVWVLAGAALIMAGVCYGLTAPGRGRGAPEGAGTSGEPIVAAPRGQHPPRPAQ